MQNESNKVEKFLDIFQPWLYADLKSDYEWFFNPGS